MANVEKQEGNKSKQSHGGHAKLYKIMNQMCQNHGFPVNHLDKDCHTYKREIIDAGKDKAKGSRSKKRKDDTKEDDKDSYPNIEGVMIIFGGL
jgi:hypothetical protein